MKRTAKHIALFFMGLFPILLPAQENDPEKIIEAIIESHLDKLDEQTDVALVIEDLEELAENPININATNEQQLARLYLLDNIQIRKLLDYIEQYGPAYSVYELNSIDGFTPELLSKMQPFIRFGPKTGEAVGLADDLKYGRHQLLFRGLGTLQKARGYLPNEEGITPYEGNRFRYYSRYRFEARDKLSVGVTAEKDPGEAFFKGSNKHGFDFYSGHLSFTTRSAVKNITVGDYLVRAGQGLVLWQGYTTGKSENVMGISKTGQGVRPYTSVEENLYFRGAATSLKFGNGELGLFYSRKKADGNIAGNDSTGLYFTSLQTSGYHRTPNEIDDEKTVTNTNAGGMFTWNFNHLKIGATFSYQHFNMPFIRSNQLYNTFRFSGNENFTGGVDYLFSKGKYRLFGETAMSKSQGMATVQGAVIHLNDRLSFSALFRHFDRDYHALWANTFAEGTNISNESGLYFGARFLPAKYITLSVYSDVYRSEWINYTTAGPAGAWDVFAQAEFRFSEKFNFYLRFKNEEKEQKNKEEKRYVNLRERTQKSRLHFQYLPSENITLRTRLEHVLFKAHDKEHGLLVFQDVQFAPAKLPLKITGRLAWFNTDSYDSRIYAYENDLLYTFSVPAYYGRGFRTFLLFHYRVNPKTGLWLRFSNTSRNDTETISSGYNLIGGNNKTELKFQLRLKF